MMKIKKEKYLEKNKYVHRLHKKPDKKFPTAVIIPANDEYETLPKTLESLEQNSPDILSETAIIIIINNPPEKFAPPDIVFSNYRTFEMLLNFSHHSSTMKIFLIDAFSQGLEISPKEGVGGARRIATDLSLNLLDWSNDPIIISLDADTLVEKNYLCEIRNFFKEREDCVAAAIHFEHQKADNKNQNIAVIRHELLMRYYVAGLTFAGSPYAYHTLGSAMAFRASAYISAGGMPRKNGGEDFYMLQALRKIGRIGLISNTTVYPSSRISDRVPFGTGPRLKQYLDGTKNNYVYNPQIFKDLSVLYSLLAKDWTILADLRAFHLFLPSTLNDFLDEENFDTTWNSISCKIPFKRENFILAFNTWFDALKTLRYVHFCELRKDKFPAIPNIEAFKGLVPTLNSALQKTLTEEKLLKILREREKIYGSDLYLS